MAKNYPATLVPTGGYGLSEVIPRKLTQCGRDATAFSKQYTKNPLSDRNYICLPIWDKCLSGLVYLARFSLSLQPCFGQMQFEKGKHTFGCVDGVYQGPFSRDVPLPRIDSQLSGAVQPL